MLIPCCPKKVGSQLTKPKISVLTVISTTQPTTSRGSKAGLNSEANVQSGVGTAGAGARRADTRLDVRLAVQSRFAAAAGCRLRRADHRQHADLRLRQLAAHFLR